MGRLGFAVTKLQLLNSVDMLVKRLNRNNKFVAGRPRRHLMEEFLQTHQEIREISSFEVYV